MNSVDRIRLYFKMLGLAGDTQYLVRTWMTKKKICFVELAREPNVKKLFISIIYKCSQWVRLLVPGNPFQTSLNHTGKDGAYSSEAPFQMFFSFVASWTYPQTSD